MPEIGELLDQEARQIRPSPDEGLERVFQRARHRRGNRRVAAGFVGMAVFLGMAASLWAALGQDDRPVAPASRTPTERETAASDEDEPAPIGPKVRVASGTIDDRPWRLQAFWTAEGLCMSLDSGLSCGPPRSRLQRGAPPILMVFTNSSYEAASYEREQTFNATWIYGVVSPEVAALELVTEGDVARPVSIVEKDMGIAVRFYVLALEEVRGGATLIALGADGSALQQMQVNLGTDAVTDS
jgi:hypothetical protein